MKKEKRFIITEEDQHRLSEYGKFHFKCLGFNFQDVLNGKIYTKGDFWDSFRAKAESITNRHGKDPLPPSGFRLVGYSHENDLNEIIAYLDNRQKERRKA
jgi:hypothetical protein